MSLFKAENVSATSTKPRHRDQLIRWLYIILSPPEPGCFVCVSTRQNPTGQANAVVEIVDVGGHELVQKPHQDNMVSSVYDLGEFLGKKLKSYVLKKGSDSRHLLKSKDLREVDSCVTGAALLWSFVSVFL